MRYSGACALLVSLVPIGISTAGADPAIRPGDHIAIIGNTYADQLRIHGYLETLLLQRTQGNPVSIRNLGWGGDTLSIRERPTNFPTEESALLAHKTDVIVICFGMGESYAGKAGLSDFRSHLKRIIVAHKGKKYNGESTVRIALVSPIAHEDHGELSNAGTDAVTLKDGRQLIIYNHTVRGGGFPSGRNMLNAAVSSDGKKWKPVLTLERAQGEYSYPAIIQARDHKIHVTYTYRRQSIKHVVMDPAKF